MYMNHRIFDRESHEHFARISSDHNPIHMDAIAARRTHSGIPIVHGIHSLIWLLESFVQSRLFALDVATLKVQFLHPIFVGDKVTLKLSNTEPNVVRGRMLVGAVEVLIASIRFQDLDRIHPVLEAKRSFPISPPESPRAPSLEEMSGLSGCLSFNSMISAVSTLAPFTTQAFGSARIAGLLCSSCLVGMVVPGLHSLLSGAEFSFCRESGDTFDGLQFTVLSISKRTRSVRIAVSAPGLIGVLDTTNRMPPTRQPSVQQLAPRVSSGEFRNTNALIVGGSRGLGELTAKLIAAGGGDIVLTYATGSADAEAVVREIRRAGSKAAAVAYDVRRPAAEQLASLESVPAQLYYFATPPIFRRKEGLFDAERFAEFNLFYLSSFFELVLTCSRLRRGGIQVFYPSSNAIGSRPGGMTEYSMSKAAGEVLCADISRFFSGIQVLTRRLPRLPTDQTSSAVEVQTVDPISEMLAVVRAMHELKT